MNWIDRTEAMARLKVKPQTLYAYVSRGQITAQPHPDDPRSSLYSEVDIDGLVQRRRSGRGRQAIAKAAIAWGDPVMETAITTVRNGMLIYRGRDAVAFARDGTLEDTAALLWQAPSLNSRHETEAAPPGGKSGKARILSFLASRAATDLPAFGRPQSVLVKEGADLLAGVCSAITGSVGRGLFHQRLGRFWGLDPEGVDILRRALVLVSDHELNPSSFAARVAAATGASLAASALSGCATLTGPSHGEAAARAVGYLRHALEKGPDAAISAIASRKETLPATGHTLYPQGDPRAAAMLKWLRPRPELTAAIRAIEAASGEDANVDMALAAITVQLDLPDDAPFLIFAAGRMTGWIAHAMEQSQSGTPIRPRARYTGP